MKWLTLVVILSSVLPVCGREERPKAVSSERAAAQSQKPTSPTPSTIPVNQQTSATKQNGAENHPKSYLSRLFSPENLPNIGLFVAGVIGIIVGICTLSVLRRQTDSMERSSGVLMNTEQGRILTYWDQFVHLDSSRQGVHDGTLSHHFNWRCGNVGKSPVILTETWARFLSVRRLSDLPAKPDYSARNKISYQGEPLLPFSHTPQTEWFSTPLETALSFEEMEIKYRSKQCVLYAYGYARYTDIWERLHETRFGVFYDAQPEMQIGLDGWVVAGAPEYNKST